MSLENLLEATVLHAQDVPERDEFRVSSLPYCGILDYLKKPTDTRKEDFSFSFYTMIGTALHEAFQKTMPLVKVEGVRLFGNWKCGHSWKRLDADGNTQITLCGKRKEWSFQPKSFKGCDRGDCPKTCVYDELEVMYEHGGATLSGHIDMLIEVTVRVKGKLKVYFHILDFKTTGNTLFDFPHRVAKYYPSKKYLVQIETYATLLWLLKKIQVFKYSIVYIAREKPLNKKNRANMKLFTYKFTNEVLVKHKQALKRSAVARSLVMQIKNTASASKRSQLLNDLIELKPCKSKAEYELGMSAAFYKEPCALYANGVCFKHQDKLKSYLERPKISCLV